MRQFVLSAILLLGASLAGCPTETTANPFLTATEYGLVDSSVATDAQANAVATGLSQEIPFRRSMQLAFLNSSTTYELQFYFVAWVLPSSISNEEQEDALYQSNFNRLDSEVKLGTAFTLPEGTFVYNGTGVAGASRIYLNPATAGATEQDAATPTVAYRTMITPDAILVFSDMPESCDSVAFEFLRDGIVATDIPLEGSGIYHGAASVGGYKTMAQIDAYRCDPFLPGLSLKQGGGMRNSNEFIEGENVLFTFSSYPTDGVNFARVQYVTQN